MAKRLRLSRFNRLRVRAVKIMGAKISLPEVGQVPVIGPWVGKISLIQDMWAEPCQPNPVIWALATVASVPLLAVTLLKPDTIDTYYDRGKRTHAWKRRKKVTLESLLEIVKGGKGPGIPKGFQLAGDLAQKVGFYMILIDATLDLAINSTSLAYQWTGCEGYENSIGYLNADYVYGAGTSQALFSQWQNPGSIWTPLSWTLPNNEGRQFSVSCAWEPYLDNETPASFVTMEVVNITRDIVKQLPQGELDPLGYRYGGAALMPNYQATSGTSAYQLHLTSDGQFKVNGNVYIYDNNEDPRRSIGFDP